MAYPWDDVPDETPLIYPDFMLPELRTFEDQECRDEASWVGSLILFMSCCGWQYPGHDHAQDYYSDLLYEEEIQLKMARQCSIARAGLKDRKQRLRKRYGMASTGDGVGVANRYRSGHERCAIGFGFVDFVVDWRLFF